jgi:hypothetical protein
VPVGNVLAQVIHAALNAEISTPTNRKALVNRLFDAAQNLAADELQRVIEVDELNGVHRKPNYVFLRV